MLIGTDLFGQRTGARSLPGLSSWPEVISAGQELELIERIDATELAPFRFQGWLGKRQTRSYGWTYDFDTGRFARGEPLPRWLADLRDEIAPVAGLPADDLVQALLIRYDPGAGIGWHRDRPVFEHVVGLSLGNAATLRFRRRAARGFERFSLEAPSRSLYRLSGEARRDWEHSIADMTIPRRSITFRTLERIGRLKRNEY